MGGSWERRDRRVNRCRYRYRRRQTFMWAAQNLGADFAEKTRIRETRRSGVRDVGAAAGLVGPAGRGLVQRARKERIFPRPDRFLAAIKRAAAMGGGMRNCSSDCDIG